MAEVNVPTEAIRSWNKLENLPSSSVSSCGSSLKYPISISFQKWVIVFGVSHPIEKYDMGLEIYNTSTKKWMNSTIPGFGNIMYGHIPSSRRGAKIVSSTMKPGVFYLFGGEIVHDALTDENTIWPQDLYEGSIEMAEDNPEEEFRIKWRLISKKECERISKIEPEVVEDADELAAKAGGKKAGGGKGGKGGKGGGDNEAGVNAEVPAFIWPEARLGHSLTMCKEDGIEKMILIGGKNSNGMLYPREPEPELPDNVSEVEEVQETGKGGKGKKAGGKDKTPSPEPEENVGEVYNKIWVFNTETETWSNPQCTGQSPFPRTYHTASSVANGTQLILFGGNFETYEKSMVTNEVFVLDMLTLNWSIVVPNKKKGIIPPPMAWHQSAIVVITEEVVPESKEVMLTDRSNVSEAVSTSGKNEKGSKASSKDKKGGKEKGGKDKKGGKDNKGGTVGSKEDLLEQRESTKQSEGRIWLRYVPPPPLDENGVPIEIPPAVEAEADISPMTSTDEPIKDNFEYFVVFGGYSNENMVEPVMYELSEKGVWRKVEKIIRTTDYPSQRYAHSLTTITGNKELFLFGGSNGTGFSISDAYIFDTAPEPEPEPEPEADPSLPPRIVYDNGDIYTGEMENGTRQGKGTYEYATGDVYKGEWKTDLREGEGECHYADGSIYVGGWKEDHKHGHGMYRFKEEPIGPDSSASRAMTPSASGDINNFVNELGGNNAHSYSSLLGTLKHSQSSPYIQEEECIVEISYEGDWCKDIREGQGKCVYLDGSTYEGTWKEDIPSGFGTYTCVGKQYEGTWADGQLTKGKETIVVPNIETLPNKEVYEGSFIRKVRNGWGVCKYIDGSEYEGDWRHGKPNGFGTFKNSINREIYSGKFIGGNKIGRCKIQYPSGSKFEGCSIDCVQQGTGVLTKGNGTSFRGMFVDGSKEGPFIVRLKNGKEFNFDFIENVLQEDPTIDMEYVTPML